MSRGPRARGAPFGVLDLGSAKVACLVARAGPDGVPRVLGHAWTRAGGVKAGNVVDLAEAERSARAAVAAAEEMADLKLSGVVVNLSCGQPSSRVFNVQWPVNGRAVTETDLRAVVAEGRRRAAEEGRETVHVLPLGFALDETPGVEDPRGMVCETLTARLHLVDAASASLRNLGTCLIGCHLEVEEPVSAPYAAALAALSEEERELGAVVLDMGGGTTTLALVSGGRLLHTAQVPVGGWNVTNDLARGLATSLAQAERVKTLHGGVTGTADDEREMIAVAQLGEEGEEGGLCRVPRSTVLSIIRPRIEETLELARQRLDAAGLPREAGARVVLTGGASQLVGLREAATRILGRPARLARLAPPPGLPEDYAAPGFATTLGLLAWASGEGRPALDLDPAGRGPSRGLLNRLADWLRERV